MMVGVNVIIIYFKHICKYHNVSPIQLLYINKLKKSNFQKKKRWEEISEKFKENILDMVNLNVQRCTEEISRHQKRT
jgi:hypothetical protein